MTKELDGRVAIVTGVGPQHRPRDRACAGRRRRGGRGQCAREPKRGRGAWSREIERAGGKALAVTADVADAEAVQQMVGRRGRSGSAASTFSSTTPRCAREKPLDQHELERMARGHGSRARRRLPLREGVPAAAAQERRRRHRQYRRADRRIPAPGTAPTWSTAKAGLVGFTRALAHDLAGDKVTVELRGRPA